MQSYTKRLRATLSPEVARLLKKLSTPEKIQDYLDALQINFDTSGDLLSTKRIIALKHAQCIEGALLAAAALCFHGTTPLLLDFQTESFDEDHVVALFKRDGMWGAISKTNHAILRWRDPLYRSIRELSMSYFHEYYMHNGRKTMRAYSKPFDLRRYKPEFWVLSESSLEELAYDLDRSQHFSIVSKNKMRTLRRASHIERKMLDLVEYKKSN